MKLRITSTALSALAIIAIVAVGGITGCGNSASGDDTAAVGTLASINDATDLSGTWILNKDLSDHPRRPDSLHRPDGANRHDGWRRHGGRGSRPDSLHGNRRMHGPMTFVIQQTDTTVEITGPRGRTRVLYPDGRVITHTRGDDSLEFQVTASWNSENALVVVGTGPRGGTRTETFSLSADGRQLFIDTHVDPAGERKPRDFRRVFDAASASN